MNNKNMKAVQINSYGGSEVFKVVDVAIPSPGKDQITVGVRAVSINPFDVKLISGKYKDMIPLQFPVTPGGDFSGVVERFGGEVEGYRVGDEVYGTANVLYGGSGSFAEFATANTANIAHKPKSASFEEAAALVLVGVSALQALEEHIKLQSKQKILIHGGAGGIGHLAIQLAKALGAYVATTVSTDEVDFVKKLGADEVIDYKKEKFEDLLNDYDVVFDMVGGEVRDKSFRILKKGGILVSMLGQPSEELSQKYGVVAIGQNTKVTSERLNRLAEYVDSGKIKVNIDRMFLLDQIKEAFNYFKEGRYKGKVVLRVKD